MQAWQINDPCSSSTAPVFKRLERATQRLMKRQMRRTYEAPFLPSCLSWPVQYWCVELDIAHVSIHITQPIPRVNMNNFHSERFKQAYKGSLILN